MTDKSLYDFQQQKGDEKKPDSSMLKSEEAWIKRSAKNKTSSLVFTPGHLLELSKEIWKYNII